MDSVKQKLLLEYLISSSDTFSICQAIVKPDYFDPEFRNAVRFVKQYFEKYHSTPEPAQIEAESGLKLDHRNVGTDEVQYCCDEIETFCKRAAMKHAFLSSVDKINTDDFGYVDSAIKEALLVSLNRDMGLRYFDNPEERLKRMLDGNFVESTGWGGVDELLFGGVSRRELLLISAGPGGGKSLCLANLGLNFVERGLDVLYISLELSQDTIALRYDTMLTGISRKVWQQHTSEIAISVTNQKEGKGHLDIKQMPSGTNAQAIRAYLKEYNLIYGKMPDLLILDYLDLMNPNEKIDLSDIWTKDKLVAEQLRDIGVEFNMVVATASQLNRQAVKAAQHDHSHIAGGISKINTADVYWSIHFNDAQRAKGEIVFSMQKTRNSDGVGKNVFLKWVPSHLRIVDQEKDKDLTFVKRNKKVLRDEILGELPSGNRLEDLLSSTS